MLQATIIRMSLDPPDCCPCGSQKNPAGELVRERFGKRLQFVRMETIFDAESEIRGYMVVVKP